MRQTRFTPLERQDKNLIEQTWNEVRSNMGILQDALAERDYIGKTFSIGDMAVLPYIYLATDLGLDITPWSSVAAYYKRLSVRPAWQKVIGWK